MAQDNSSFIQKQVIFFCIVTKWSVGFKYMSQQFICSIHMYTYTIDNAFVLNLFWAPYMNVSTLCVCRVCVHWRVGYMGREMEPVFVGPVWCLMNEAKHPTSQKAFSLELHRPLTSTNSNLITFVLLRISPQRDQTVMSPHLFILMKMMIIV